MTLEPGMRLVAVYDTRDAAATAARRAIEAGVSDEDVRLDDPRDHVASVEGEMRDEIVHTTAGPGAVGPFTEEVAEGMLLGIVVAGAIGLVLALPFAAIAISGIAVWTRLLIVAIVGAVIGATVHVLTRSEAARRLALELGCASARDAYDLPPEPLDAAVLFAPVGDLVPSAMRALDRGGTLAIAGIHLTDVPKLVYDDALFEERVLTSTTANTRRDGEELLELATTIPLRVTTVPYAFDDADRALVDLAHDRFTGAAVLHM